MCLQIKFEVALSIIIFFFVPLKRIFIAIPHAETSAILALSSNMVNYLLSLVSMSNKEHFKFSTGVIAYPVLFVLIIWLVFWFEVRFGVNFSKYGVYPQTVKGLRGIVLSPFIHGDIQHIYHNTIPLFVLSTALFYFYRPIAWKILIFGILFSGFLTWYIGRLSYHHSKQSHRKSF